MTNPERQASPRRSNPALVALVVCICVASFGILLTAAGFFLGLHIGFTVGVLFIPIGLFGAVISAIVWAVTSTRTTTTPPPGVSPTGAPPGWYPDAQNPAMVRYFDGRMWTSATQPRR